MEWKRLLFICVSILFHGHSITASQTSWIDLTITIYLILLLVVVESRNIIIIYYYIKKNNKIIIWWKKNTTNHQQKWHDKGAQTDIRGCKRKRNVPRTTTVVVCIEFNKSQDTQTHRRANRTINRVRGQSMLSPEWRLLCFRHRWTGTARK